MHADLQRTELQKWKRNYVVHFGAVVQLTVLLDADMKTMIAAGDPRKLLAESRDPKVINFLTGGEGQAEKAERWKSMDRRGKQ